MADDRVDPFALNKTNTRGPSGLKHIVEDTPTGDEDGDANKQTDEAKKESIDDTPDGDTPLDDVV